MVLRTHRILVTAFLAVAVLGVVMVMRSWMARRAFEAQGIASGVSSEAPLVHWWDDAPRKEELVSGLQPAPPSAVVVMEAARAVAQRLLARTGRARFQARMIRTLENGTQLGADLRGEIDWHGEVDGEVSLTAYRDTGDTVVIDATLRDGALVDGRIRGRDGALQFRPGLPVGIGDLQVSDLTGLFRAMDAGAIAVAGLDASGDLVLELHFGEDDTEDDPAAVRGHSALVWMRPDSGTLVRVRVFNRDERMVRVVEEFDHADGQLQSVVVRSLAHRSHTRFVLTPD